MRNTRVSESLKQGTTASIETIYTETLINKLRECNMRYRDEVNNVDEEIKDITHTTNQDKTLHSIVFDFNNDIKKTVVLESKSLEIWWESGAASSNIGKRCKFRMDRKKTDLDLSVVVPLKNFIDVFKPKNLKYNEVSLNISNDVTISICDEGIVSEQKIRNMWRWYKDADDNVVIESFADLHVRENLTYLIAKVLSLYCNRSMFVGGRKTRA